MEDQNKIKCPKCEKDTRKDKFCNHCGEELEPVTPPGKLPQRSEQDLIDSSIIADSTIDKSVKTQIDNHSTHIGSVSYNAPPQEQGAICPICKIHNKDLNRTFYCEYCTRRYICEHHKKPIPSGTYCGDENCKGARIALSQPYWGPQQYPPPPSQTPPQGYPPNYTVPSHQPFPSVPPGNLSNQQQQSDVPNPQTHPTGHTPDFQRKEYIRKGVSSGKEEVLMEFWTSLLETAKAKTDLHANVKAGTGAYVYTRLKKSLQFVYLVRKNDTQIEIYVTSGNKTKNKAIYDSIHTHKEQIESEFGGNLKWERLDDKDACRISKSLDVGSYKNRDRWKEIQETMIDTMVRLENAVAPYIEKLTM